MNASHMGISLLLLCLLSFILEAHSQLSPDALSMKALKASLGNPEYKGWSNQDPCKWRYITCWNNRITKIQLSNLNLTGSLPPDLRNLSSLVDLDVANNQLTGPIPSLGGLSSLQNVLLNNNFFSYIPSDFFKGLTSLRSISFDHNPFSSWEIPESLKDATHLHSFSANAANISGTIPDFLGGDTFPQLVNLQLAMNNLQGQIPSSFSKSSIQILRLNDQNRNSSLNGSVAVLQNMTSLTQVWLQFNRFTGPFPDLSRLLHLKCLSLSDNQLTGIVPLSLVSISTLTTVYLKNNWLQGPTPEFDKSKVVTDVVQGGNSFCLDDPGVACNSRVNNLLSIAQSVGYPVLFAQSWKGNDPCNTSMEWKGIICDEGNIVMVNFENLTLSGTISPNFSMIKSLKVLILSGNTLTGTIPKELKNLLNLRLLDVSHNHLHGKVPNFRLNVAVITDGNPDIEPYVPPMSSPGKPPSSHHGDGKSPSDVQSRTSNTRKIVGYVTSTVCGLLVIVGFGVFLYTRKRKHCRYWKHLRNSTNNFDQKNILGIGGFGTVYKGELPDGTKIAVKRMKSGVVSEQGLTEFKSEIEVLTEVQHCHLVALLGYCRDGNEGLLVYEYMPQGNLSRHLFSWKEEGVKPLEWTRRLSIALDVARGLEYLHGLAHQSFIHRDLKPSNILLGDDMKAKVADFGLARLIPGKGGHSIETRLVGTPGYIAPEYIVTGRVTTKVDVFSFGVILMELITGKKAIDPTLPEDMVHLIPWFRRMHTNKHTFPMAIDQTIELDEKTLASVSTVAELADHCCTGEPHQRPDMNHAVNVLSSLVELWRPVQPFYDDIYGISLDRSSIVIPNKNYDNRLITINS